MSSGGKNNLGPRLLVMLFGLALVVLGAYPIRKHYGGVRGLYHRAFPGGFQWSLPDMRSIRAYLVSLDQDRRRRQTPENSANYVKTVKLAPEPERRAGRGGLGGLFDFFTGGESSRSSSGEAARPAVRDRSGRPVVAGSGGRDKTDAREDLKVPPKGGEKSLDKLTQKDREELNDLIDGF